MVELYVTNIGDMDLILGSDWLKTHNPGINWRTSEINFDRCPASCTTKNPPIKAVAKIKPKSILKPPHDPREHHKDYMVKWKDEEQIGRPVAVTKTAGQRRPVTYHQVRTAKVLFTNDEDAPVDIEHLWTQDIMEEVFRHDDYPRPSPPSMPASSEINIRATFTKAQELAEAANKSNEKLPVSDQVPPPYHEYLSVFDEQKSFRLPKYGPNDHAIDLKPDFIPSHEHIIQLSAKEDPELTKFIKTHQE
jgi:hypothetical protein